MRECSGGGGGLAGYFVQLNFRESGEGQFTPFVSWLGYVGTESCKVLG